MNLKGSLDAFGLPDVFALLSTTGKTGGLLLRRSTPAGLQGVVWFRDGRICGASGLLRTRRTVGDAAQALDRGTGEIVGVAALLRSR